MGFILMIVSYCTPLRYAFIAQWGLVWDIIVSNSIYHYENPIGSHSLAFFCYTTLERGVTTLLYQDKLWYRLLVQAKAGNDQTWPKAYFQNRKCATLS